jgi:hypothetical protein
MAALGAGGGTGHGELDRSHVDGDRHGPTNRRRDGAPLLGRLADCRPRIRLDAREPFDLSVEVRRLDTDAVLTLLRSDRGRHTDSLRRSAPLVELDALVARAELMREALRTGMRCGCLRIEDCDFVPGEGCTVPGPVLPGRRVDLASARA